MQHLFNNIVYLRAAITSESYFFNHLTANYNIIICKYYVKQMFQVRCDCLAFLAEIE